MNPIQTSPSAGCLPTQRPRGRQRVANGAAAILLAVLMAQAQAQAPRAPAGPAPGAAPAPAPRPEANAPVPHIIRPSATLGPAAPGVPGPAPGPVTAGAANTGAAGSGAAAGAPTAAASPASSPTVTSVARYRSVAKPDALMYDAPSDKARKLFVAPQGMPVAVVSVLRPWVKVRDPLGDLAWISRDDLADRRMVMATAITPLRKEAESNAPAWFSVDRGVVLELLDEQPVNGFVKVRYAEGQEGYLPRDQVWGL